MCFHLKINSHFNYFYIKKYLNSNIKRKKKSFWNNQIQKDQVCIKKISRGFRQLSIIIITSFNFVFAIIEKL